MEKQRICIIGDGLSGLTSAIAINNLDNVEVHLISKKSKKVTIGMPETEYSAFLKYKEMKDKDRKSVV